MTQPVMQFLGRFSVPTDHPCLPGHFPGAPTIPGVLLLDEVIGLVLPRCSGFRLAGLPQVRFLAPVWPAEVVLVEAALPVSPAAEVLRIGFVAQAEGRIVLKGNLDLQAVT